MTVQDLLDKLKGADASWPVVAAPIVDIPQMHMATGEDSIMASTVSPTAQFPVVEVVMMQEMLSLERKKYIALGFDAQAPVTIGQDADDGPVN